MIVNGIAERRVSAEAAASTGSADLIASILGATVVVGVYLDGRSHLLNLPDSFFTPWHGVLYSAVLGLGAWLVVLGRRHGRGAGGLFRMPRGYGMGLVGAVLFVAGGGIDLLWHTAFGIEVGIDALLSPAHLWLFTAGALLLSGPVRAALAHRGAGTNLPRLTVAAAVVAVTSLAALAAFVLSFLSAYLSDAPTRPLPHLPEGTAEHAAVEIPASWGLASFLMTSLVLAVPLAWLILRWWLPFGAATGYLTALALLAYILMDYQRPYAVAATAIAGLVVDTFLSVARHRGVSARSRAVGSAVLIPAVAWTAFLAGLAATEGLRWPPALTGGVVALSALLSAVAAAFLTDR